MPNVNCWGEQRLCVKMVEVLQWGIISSRTCNLSINVMILWWEVSSKGFSIKLVDMMLACTFVLIRSVPDGLYYCLRRYSWQWGLGIFFQSNKQQSPPERWIFFIICGCGLLDQRERSRLYCTGDCKGRFHYRFFLLFCVGNYCLLCSHAPNRTYASTLPRQLGASWRTLTFNPRSSLSLPGLCLKPQVSWKTATWTFLIVLPLFRDFKMKGD